MKDTRKKPENVTGSMDVLLKEGKENGAALAVADDGTEIQVLEVTDFQLVDAQITAEILDRMRGVFTQDVVYNKPIGSSKGQKKWPACARMPGGKCSMQGYNHIHIVGVGYQGALVAMNVYGGLDVSCPDMPVITEQGDKQYWVVKVVCVDSIRRNRLERWHFETSVKTRRGGGFYIDENAQLTVQSKGMRNLILAAIPQRLQKMWIDDYLAGRDPFDPQRVLEMGRSTNGVPIPATAPAKSLPPAAKETSNASKTEAPPPTAGMLDLAGACVLMAQKLSTPKLEIKPAVVENWARSAYKTDGQAMVGIVQALTDDSGALLSDLKVLFDAWLKAEQEMEPGQTEMGV